MLAVALSKEGYTHKLIQEVKEFVIAVPNKKLQKYINVFGTKHGNKINKFGITKIPTTKAKFIKVPLLKEATVNFECKLEKKIEAGDHFIFIGRILAAYINEKEGVLLNMGKRKGKRIFKEFESVSKV
jgi:flavin reductase (DIM6/NTAB) family NADH-FMN oxidoreductase RutF